MPSAQILQNVLHDTVCILKRLIVPDTDDTKASRFQICGTPLVSFLLNIVLSAIDLDDQSPLDAQEIDDVRTDRGLMAKFASVELPASKLQP